MRALALDLAAGSARLGKIDYRQGEARALLAEAAPADLVVASYMIGEIGDAERRTLVDLMWAKTRDTLLIVEPGTPAGYGRIIAAREQLIASGAHVAAPCPHDGKCPLAPPDWCHFTQRLPRSRAHKQIKEADVPFEDEKFSYVALTRSPIARHPARVLAQPDRRQGRGERKTLHRRRSRHRKNPPPRQSRLRPRPALALGRCGDGGRLGRVLIN